MIWQLPMLANRIVSSAGQPHHPESARSLPPSSPSHAGTLPPSMASSLAMHAAVATRAASIPRRAPPRRHALPASASPDAL